MVQTGSWNPSGTLETSRSIKRTLISSEESPSRSSGKICTTPLSSISVERALTRSSAGILVDDLGIASRYRTRWYGLLVVLTMLALVVLACRPLYDDWLSVSSRCPLAPPAAVFDRGMGFLTNVEGKSGNSHVDVVDVEEMGVELAGIVDDETCWSRTRHSIFRPRDRQLPPSPALMEALREYEALHSRCTAGKQWESLADFEPKDGEESCKYIIYDEGWEGLGNRLLALVSSFAYALASDRVLLIDSRGHLAKLFCEPFGSSSWKLPNGFQYATISELPTLENVANIENQVGVSLNLRHQQSRRDSEFFCEKTEQKLAKVPLIVWKSNQYYVTRLFMIPSIWKKLSPLFPNPSWTFSQLGRYLCLPENAVWAKTERIYEAYLASSAKLVGVQVRIATMSNFSQDLHDRMMNCLLGNQILPNVSQDISIPRSFNPGEPTPSHEEKTERRTSRGGGAVRVFVASLHRKYFTALREFYVDGGTEDGSLVSVHILDNEGEERQEFEQAVKALIDIWLLSFSDTLVTSGWSTFGYAAQGLGGTYPVIMNLRLGASEPFCYKGQSVEPCTHYPFLSACGSTEELSKDHREWIKVHLRSCQDEPKGIQLF